MNILKSRGWRVTYPVLLLIGVAALFVVTARPSPASLYNRINGGTINFAVDRQLILHPWQCVNATWEVEGIEKVFFDDSAGVGQQSTAYCPASANQPDPSLYIDFQGNFIQQFVIPVTVVTQTAAFWAAVAGVVLIGLLTYTPRFSVPTLAPADAANRRRLLAGVGAALLLSAIGVTGWAAREPGLVTTEDGWVLREDEVKSE